MINLILIFCLVLTNSLLFQPHVTLSLCLNFKEFQPLHACKGYTYEKECVFGYMVLYYDIRHGM